MPYEAMIDIETLSTRNNASILTIGAIKFNRNDNIEDLDTLKKNGKTFYARITRSSCDNLNLHVDTSTVDWWRKQSSEAQYEAFYNTDRISIIQALKKLSIFLQDCDKFWSQGSFDYNILENVYRQININFPWKFWQIRDSRTLFDFSGVDIKKINYSGNDHNSLDDCYKQLLGVLISFKHKK
jgi:hypothetical protein